MRTTWICLLLLAGCTLSSERVIVTREHNDVEMSNQMKALTVGFGQAYQEQKITWVEFYCHQGKVSNPYLDVSKPSYSVMSAGIFVKRTFNEVARVGILPSPTEDHAWVKIILKNGEEESIYAPTIEIASKIGYTLLYIARKSLTDT